jgi:hypothetical protein
MRTIDKIIAKVFTRYDAPMGRANKGELLPNDQRRVYDCSVPLTEGHNKGGAYWGCGAPLRVKYTKDLSFIEFYRCD